MKTEKNSISKHWPSGPMLSISRFVHMCVCVSVCVSVCSLLRYRLNVFLPTLPEVGCPKILEIRNHRGSNGKKWSQIWKFLIIRCVKSTRKKVCFGQNLPYWAELVWYLCFSLRLTVFFSPLPEVQCKNLLDFQDPWGKVMEKSSLIFENFCS